MAFRKPEQLTGIFVFSLEMSGVNSKHDICNMDCAAPYTNAFFCYIFFSMHFMFGNTGHNNKDVSLMFFLFCVHIALYSIILFCVFLWIPFVYFYYEERDDDNGNKCLVRLHLSPTLSTVPAQMHC